MMYAAGNEPPGSFGRRIVFSPSRLIRARPSVATARVSPFSTVMRAFITYRMVLPTIFFFNIEQNHPVSYIRQKSVNTMYRMVLHKIIEKFSAKPFYTLCSPKMENIRQLSCLGVKWRERLSTSNDFDLSMTGQMQSVRCDEIKIRNKYSHAYGIK